ncbi:hypothetical protein J4438_01445, partial [Candidatus Woesearchaeota archaeon]|nr:hypothetical protein [Candidatus Woesearchaeota archaeon]
PPVVTPISIEIATTTKSTHFIPESIQIQTRLSITEPETQVTPNLTQNAPTATQTPAIPPIQAIIVPIQPPLGGAPSNKGAGLYLYKKVNNEIKKGEKLFTIYSENKEKLELAKTAIDSAIIVK